MRTGLSSHPGSLRYVLQIEGVRVLAYLLPQQTDPVLRLLAPGCRYTVALARRHPDVVGEGGMREMDSEATSSSSGIGSDFREQGNPQPQATSQGPSEASESSQEMWLLSEYGSSREEQLNMMMEFMRVHDFHDWDQEYRPDVVEDRVLRWWRDEHRIPWQPEVEGLNHSEIASVRMMVGYLMQPRSPATRSSTLSPPVMRSYEVISCNSPGFPSIPSYLGGAIRREEGPALRMLEVIDDGQESEPERTTVSRQGADATSYHQAWEPGEMEVELSEPEVTPEAVEEVTQLHARTLASVRRLAREVEGWAMEPEMNDTLTSLLRDQASLRDSMEEWLIQVQSQEEQGRLSSLTLPAASGGHQGCSLTGEVPQDTFLHTRTVSLPEVRKELDRWYEPACEELDALFNRTKACRRTTDQQVQEWAKQGITVHVLPGKAVCARKAGVGKRRLRAVVCGNFLPRESSSEDSTYATGVEAVSVRAALAIASRRLWRPTGLDIRTAFLNAPVRVPNKTIIIVKPPRILIDLQLVTEEERWIVDRALYGLTSSPRDWSVYRDQTLQSLPIPSVLGTLRLEQCKSDGNLWKLVCPKGVIQGVVVIYVDDIMCLASVPQAQELWEAIRATWKTTDPSWASEQEPLSFCGLEIYWNPEYIWIQQTRYIADLLSRYEVSQYASSPMSTWNPPETPTEIDIPAVREAQKVTGELLWIATRSRPDLSYPVGKLAQYSTKARRR